MVAATIILPSYPKLCIAGAGELLVSVGCYFNEDGLLGVFAPVVRGVLWPARAVNTLEFPDLGALCKRGARAFGKAVNDDGVQEDDEDESDNDDARSEEAAPRGGARSEPAAPRLLGSHRVVWVERAHVDRARRVVLDQRAEDQAVAERFAPRRHLDVADAQPHPLEDHVLVDPEF